MAVWIEESIGHAVVTWVEVAVRAISRGHDQVVWAEVEVEMAGVVVQGQCSGAAGEAEAKGVSTSVGVVEEAARVEGEVGIEAGEVEARRTGVVLGEEVGVVVPMLVEAVGVATL